MAKSSLNYVRTVQVAKDKSDVVQYTTITLAIAAITARGSPATGKRFAVYVHPGTYDETVDMVDWVDVIAIGGREETVISNQEGAGGTDHTPTVSGANAMIKGFSIVSDGTNKIPRCINADADGFEIDDCVLTISPTKAGDTCLAGTASFTMTRSIVDSGEVADIGVSLATDAKIYSIHDCQINCGAGGTDAAINLADDTVTLNLTGSYVTDLVDVDGGDIVAQNCIFENIAQAAGSAAGSIILHECYVESVATTGDTLDAYGGTIRACSASSGTRFVWWEHDEDLKVLPNMLIAHALTAGGAVATATQNVTIHLEAATYTETGLTLQDDVNLIGDSHRATIITAATTGTILTAGADVICNLLHIQVFESNSGVCLAVTAATADVHAHDCEFNSDTDAITMIAGTLDLHTCRVTDGDIELSAAACTLLMDHTGMMGGNLNSAATDFDHSVTCIFCDFNGNNINLAAIGETDTELRYCTDINTFTDAGASAGTCIIENSLIITASKGAIASADKNWTIMLARLGFLSNDGGAGTGTITIYGGYLGTCADSTSPIIWWHDNANELMVISGMKVAHAIAGASAGDTIRLGQGSWAEPDLTIQVSINIIGEGLEESIISTGDDTDPILQIGDAADATVVAVTLQGVTIQNTGTAEAIELVSGDQTTTVVARECFIDGGSAAVALAAAGTGVKTFEAFECTFNAGTTCIDVDCTAAIADIDIHNCEFTAGVVANLTGANHTFNAWDCEMGGGGITVAADVPPIVLIRCNDVGAIASLTNALTLEHCTTGNVTTTTGTVTIEHSNVGILVSGNATVNVYNSYVTEANPSNGTQTYYNCQIGIIDSDGTSAIVVHGGDIQSLDTPVSGTVVWWEGDHILKVMASTGNMKIDDALNATGLAAGDTIKLGQGTFAESGLTAVDGVDIVGEGQDLSIIEATDAGNPIITVGSNVSCVFKDVKISNLGAHQTIDLLAGTDPAVLSVENCILKSDGANSIVVVTATATDPADFTAYDTMFDTAADAITVSGATISDVIARNCAFITCTLAFSTTGANHTFDISSCDFNTAGVTLTANVPAVTIVDCDAIGTFTHSTASTVTLRNCNVSGAYTVAAVVGVVNAKDCIMGAFTDNGSGTSSFILCETGALDNAATADMSLEQCSTGTITQGAAAGTITISNSTTGALVTGAGGAIALLGMCWFPDITTNAGKITWQLDLTTWRVVDGTADMKIMDAADDAAAGDLILIGPGTFSETLDLDTGVNACTYRGMGRDKTTITATGNTVLVDGITGVVFEDLTIEASAGTDGQYALELDASTTATASVTLRNVTVDMTGSAGTVYGILVIDDGANTATVLAYDCYVEADSGGTNYAVAANTCTTGASTISLHGCELNGADYDIYNDRITIDTHSCELSGGGWWIQNNATAIGLAFNNEAPNTVTPVTFAGAAGEFADLSGAELYTCAATVLIGEAVYLSAAGNTVVEATNAAAAPIPAEGVVVYKPGGAGATTCYVKNSGMAYMATPPVAWVAGTNVWLGVTGAQLVARPSNALKQVLGVGVDTKRMLINIAPVEVVTKVATIPVWPGAGSAPTGTHVNVNSRKAVAIVGAGGQTVFSHAWEVPEDFLSLSALKVIVFPTGTGSFDWTAYSSKAASGELENDGSDTDTANTVGVTDDTILDHDITTAADGFTLAEGDHFNCDILIDVLTTITQLLVLGFRVEYNAQRGA